MPRSELAGSASVREAGIPPSNECDQGVMIDPRTPCIIGVAAHTWHPADVGAAGAPEPLDMWEQMARAAAADAGNAALVEHLDSLQIVYCQTWQYDDAVARLADRLHADPKHRYYSGIGGTTTQQLVNATAQRMLTGELDLALITSAEALATQRAYKKRGERYSYSFKPADKRAFPWESPPDPVEIAHEVFQAWLTFAVFDNARRARVGRALDDYRADIGRMLAPMTDIAAHNEHAWFPTARSAAEIITASPDNRMVGYPYTKYAVAVMDVDMAGALVLATHARAEALGVPSDRRVYLRGYAYATDPVLVAAHPDLSRSPAMEAASAAALATAGIDIDEVEHLDLYSCFASSLHFACDALGISPFDARGLTVTGGLPYHGGPASGYLTHSIAAMVERLRSEAGAYGLVSGVGMHMTKHVFGVYCSEPGTLAPPPAMPEPDTTAVHPSHAGAATVAAYSVIHGRDGAPESALLVCDLPNGARTYARLRDRDSCEAAETIELVRTTVTLTPIEVDGPMGPGIVNEAKTNL
ncbi:MAG TPA: acetyl-CoA synthetase [Acidimicrobiia bacterium]|nr:acetyl-CoA synthetase [Acidimicrobiia bacterium]